MKNQFTHIKNQVKEFLQKEIPSYANKQFLLGVSGGADSVLMVHIFKSLELEFSIAHVNYNLRGDESNGDEKFVTELAKKLNVPFFIKQVQTRSLKKTGESIQMLARTIRYDYFNEVLANKKFDHLVLAHHANDQIETVLMNLFRGCGLEGLTGMENLNGKTIRPLLACKRSEIENALKEKKIAFRTDSSNFKNDYKRNYLRNVIIPGIEEKWPGFEKTMLKNIELFKTEKNSAKKITSTFTIDFSNAFEIDIAELKNDLQKLNAFNKSAAKNGFSIDQLKNIVLPRRMNESKFVECKKGKIENKNGKLYYHPAVKKTVLKPTLTHKKNNLFISGIDTGFLKCTTEKISFSKVKGELIVRKWEKGDKLIPLGMTKPKKVSDLLTDLKLTADQKDRVYLLCDATKPLWLIGFRIDNRVKLTGNEANNGILNLSAL